MKTKFSSHWTGRSVEDFQFAIALDFVNQLETQMSSIEMKQADLAKELDVTEGRVSQIMNNPGNLTLNMMVKCVKAVGMKVSIVAYDDDDERNRRGPIHPQIFRSCWENAGKPRDVWSLPIVQTAPRAATRSVFVSCYIGYPYSAPHVDLRTENMFGWVWRTGSHFDFSYSREQASNLGVCKYSDRFQGDYQEWHTQRR